MTGEAPACDPRGRLLFDRRTNQYDFPKACRRQRRRASAPLAVPPPRAATCCDAYPAPVAVSCGWRSRPHCQSRAFYASPRQGPSPASCGFAGTRWRNGPDLDRSARAQHEEALRYAAVTAVAQSASYGAFAVLVCTLCAALPQAAVVIGAAAGALVSYNGHRLFAFAPLDR